MDIDRAWRTFYNLWYLHQMTICRPPVASERVDFNSWARNFESDPEMPSRGSVT